MNKAVMGALLLLGLCGCSDESGDVAMGVVERDRIVLSSPANEQIEFVAVEEGQHVDAGTVLLTLDGRHARLIVAQKQAMLDYAQAQLKQLEAGARLEKLSSAQAIVDAAKAQFVEEDTQYQRVLALYQRKVVNQADLDAAKAQKDRSAAQLAQANQQWLELKNGARSEEVAQAEAQVRSAQAALADAQLSLSNLTLTAPKSGEIDILPWHQGDRVPIGTPLITLLSDERLYARVYTPSTSLNHLHKGDNVSVHVAGLLEPVTGRVKNIRSNPAFTPYFALNERDRSRLMYLTEIELPQGLSLSVGTGVEVLLP